MGNLFKLVLFGIGIYLAIHMRGGGIAMEKSIADKLAPGNEVVMYSDRKSTRLNSSHSQQSRMPSSA